MIWVCVSPFSTSKKSVKFQCLSQPSTANIISLLLTGWRNTRVQWRTVIWVHLFFHLREHSSIPHFSSVPLSASTGWSYSTCEPDWLEEALWSFELLVTSFELRDCPNSGLFVGQFLWQRRIKPCKVLFGSSIYSSNPPDEFDWHVVFQGHTMDLSFPQNWRTYFFSSSSSFLARWTFWQLFFSCPFSWKNENDGLWAA